MVVVFKSDEDEESIGAFVESPTVMVVVQNMRRSGAAVPVMAYLKIKRR